eukprot:1545962-Rhodomonas_salina.1
MIKVLARTPLGYAVSVNGGLEGLVYHSDVFDDPPQLAEELEGVVYHSMTPRRYRWVPGGVSRGYLEEFGGWGSVGCGVSGLGFRVKCFGFRLASHKLAPHPAAVVRPDR